MEHRKQIIQIFEDAGISYSHKGGADLLLDNGTVFHFSINGRLEDVYSVYSEGDDDDDF